MVIVCGGQAGGVARMQDRDRKTLTPSSGARRSGSEVSQKMRAQSAEPCTTFARWTT